MLSDVYDEFSGGLTDPVAIRDFFFYAYHNWAQAPGMAVLFGDGTDDYKNYLYNSKNLVPPYLKSNGSCTDDFFAYLDPSETMINHAREPDMILGRIPVANAEEAGTVVDKIIETEDPDKRDMGPWRQRIILTADDDMINEGSYKPDEIPWHTQESESIANTIESQNKALDVKKIYLFDYGIDSKLTFPEATKDLINAINRGCMVVNYVGHGAEYGWAHERFFYSADVDKLSNNKRYPVLFSASCSVGHFDHPTRKSINEIIIPAAGKGAIASIAATRASSSNPNNELNKAFFKNLFRKDLVPVPIGRAFYLAKIASSDLSNKELYVFFGDPAIRYLWDVTGIKFEPGLDSLSAKQIATIKGRVIKNNKTYGSFNGNILLQVFKGYKEKSHTIALNNNTINYKIWDDVIFSGQTKVTSGKFEQSFLVPTKIAYGQAKSRITAFAWNNKHAAFGVIDSIYTGGTADTKINDNSGPSISFALGDSSLTGGTVFDDYANISLPADIVIILEDSMGIDVTGSGPDEGLCMEIPGVLTKTNINSRFLYDQGNFRKGQAAYYLEPGSIPAGEHDLTVTARDGLGNISAKILRLIINSDSVLTLSNVFNYPNPFSGTTKFYYKTSQASTITIKIFTRSGKLIRVIENAENPQKWNGTDQAGNRISNNMYFYKIIAKSTYKKGGQVEVLDKLMIAR